MNVQRALRDRIYYMENCLQIVTKEETLIPFRLNKPQRKVVKILTSLEDSNVPIRIVCLKARQMGLSTLFGGLLFHKTATHSFVKTVITAHKDDPSVTLFDMYNLFYKKLPEDMRPMTKYSSRRELIFENPYPKNGLGDGLLSRLSVHTAGSEDFARSKTIHNLHWSEVAFTKNARRVHSIVLSAVPKPPAPSVVFYESTANGPSGLFNELFWKAYRRENDWTAIFLAWHEAPEYAMPIPGGFALDEDEYQIQLKYDLTTEQMVWRRYTLVNDFLGDESWFMQEYPACPEEAFQSSDKCVFDMNAMREMESDIREPICRASLSDDGLLENRSGKIKVWEWAAHSCKYVVSIDAAGGKESGDKMVAHVLKIGVHSIEQVAVYVDKIHPSQFGVNCVRLAIAYNNALIAPERNYHGIAVISVIMQRGYYNMHLDADGEYGVHVGATNKYLLVDGLAQSIWRRELKVHDLDTLNALKSYQESGGRFFGPEDDYVDSMRVGLYCLPSRGYQRKVKDKVNTGWGDTWTEKDWDNYIKKNTRMVM